MRHLRNRLHLRLGSHQSECPVILPKVNYLNVIQGAPYSEAMRTIVLSASVLLAVVACSTSEVSTTDDAYEDAIRAYRPTNLTSFPRQDAANGFYFQGEEYWPYKEAEPIYPSKVQWGYESGSAAAKKCMAQSKIDLIEILKNPPAELLELKQKTGIDTFFFWNNDFTGAAPGRTASFNHLWLYEGSLIKWMSATNRDGSCALPERTDIRAFARDCLARYVPGQKLSCNAKNTAGLPAEPSSDAGRTDAGRTDAGRDAN